MTDAWFCWDSNGTWDDDDDEADWPKPLGPSEWSLFRREAEPDIVLSDGALEALAAGEKVDNVTITIGQGRMVVEAGTSVWAHILSAVSHESKSCAECKEVISIFQRVVEHIADEDEDATY